MSAATDKAQRKVGLDQLEGLIEKMMEAKITNSTQDSETRIEKVVNNIVAQEALKLTKSSLRNLLTLIVVAFGAGVWGGLLQVKFNYLIRVQETEIAANNAMLEHWVPWRAAVEEQMKTGAASHFSSFDWDTAAGMYNRKNPVVPLPTFREIQKEK